MLTDSLCWKIPQISKFVSHVLISQKPGTPWRLCRLCTAPTHSFLICWAPLRSDHVITTLSTHWRGDKHNYLCITHNPHSAHSLQTNFHITATNIIEILNDWFQNPLWIQSKSSEISNTWHLNQSLLNRIAEIIDVIAWDEPHSSHSLSCLQDRAVNSLQK